MQVFSGNTDRNTVVRQEVKPVIVARFIRIQPKSWNWHISMRTEVHGCFEGEMKFSDHLLTR
jgi:hypothetical protein